MSNLKEMKNKIGYGFGTTIGFTMDGTVFIVSDTKGPDGKPLQSFMELSPERAEAIATTLVSAAKDARNKLQAEQ